MKTTMKRIFSLLIVLVMVCGMLPMSAIHTHAAETSEELSIFGSTGTLAADSSSISWTQNGVTFTNTKASDAIRTSDTTHYRLYGKSGIVITAPSNITKIVVTTTGSDYASRMLDSGKTIGTATRSGNVITIVPTTAADTIEFSNTSASQIRLSKVVVTYADVASGECAHSNTEEIAAVDATCTETGNTAGTKCNDCGLILSGCETVAALGHKNEVSEVVDATCLEDGYTTYTCTVCGKSTKETIAAIGHNYVDGTCTGCGIEQPTGLAGKYYIAAKRSTGNYMYMTNDLGTASTKRYQIVDSGVTTLPESITAPVDAQVFELISVDGGYKIKAGDQYLGWTSGNSGTLVDEENALVVTIDSAADNTYNIHFTASDAERYLSLNSDAQYQYCAWYKSGQVMNLSLVPVAVAEEPECEHNFVEGICTICGATDPSEPEPEEVKIVFELGENGSASHNDGKEANTYTETVGDYTLNITGNKKMYTGAVDATGNGCIKLGTSSAVGGFSFEVPTDVEKVVIRIAKYKAKTTKVNVNGTEHTLSASSDNGAYDEITVDTSSSKTVSVTTVSGGVRAMVNSITFICDKADHTCDWDEGTVTKKATCTTDGEKTYSCTVEGCTKTKVETIPATGHSYDEDGACTICGVTPADVVAAAYALKSGESLEGTYTLTGVIKAVNTAYNSTFQNVTVTIDVIGVDGKPIQCYRMEGEGADQIGTGDTITVTGTLKNYNDTIEFDAGCTLDSWKDTGSDFVRPTTPEAIVNAAYALEVNASLEGGNYTLTGVISEVKNAYSAKYSDITVMMVVGDMTDKPIMCYQLKGDGVDEICVGDSITVTGTIKNYNGTVEFTPCTLDSYEIKNGHTIVVDAAVAPTYTATGLTAGEHCSVCNLVTVAQTEIPVLENPVETYNITLKDNIGINFVMKLAETDEVTVTVGGEAVDCAVVDGKLSINVAAAQMTDEIAIYVNGLPLAKTYSVRGYADEVLAGEYGANVKAMVRAMLHYGAAAQDYFNYNEGNFANLNMQDTVTNPIQAAEMVPTTGETAGIVHYGSTLVYRDRVAVRVYFKLTGDAAIDAFTFTANGEAVEAQEGSNGLYYVEIADIAPQNLDDAVTVTVNDGLTVTYSALNYITRMVNKTEDNALKTLLQQLYDYYMAAEYLVENGPDDFETEPDVVG